jgi:RNA-directed DNA polymerase
MRVRKSGSIRLSRKTQADRMRKKLNALGEHLSLIRIHGTQAMQEYVLNLARGHLQYFGITGNSRSLGYLQFC